MLGTTFKVITQAATLALALTATGCGLSAQSDPVAASGFAQTGSVQDAGLGAELGEISGLAASRRDPQLYWTLNDSGNPPLLFALRPDGSVVQRVRVQGAVNRDWEDLVSWRDKDGARWLAIADIGDNPASRRHVELLIVAEPEPGTESVPIARRIRFAWAGGPRDAEALAVDPAGGRFLLVDKRNHPQALFALPMNNPTDNPEDSPADSPSDTPATAQRLAELPPLDGQPTDGYDLISALYAGKPTSADLSPDGRRLLVLGYTHLALFERAADEPWEQAIRRTPRFYPLPPVPLFEAVAWADDGKSAMLAPERSYRGVPLYQWTAPPIHPR